MKINGVPVECGDLHFWTMVNRNGVGKPHKLLHERIPNGKYSASNSICGWFLLIHDNLVR